MNHCFSNQSTDKIFYWSNQSTFTYVTKYLLLAFHLEHMKNLVELNTFMLVFHQCMEKWSQTGSTKLPNKCLWFVAALNCKNSKFQTSASNLNGFDSCNVLLSRSDNSEDTPHGRITSLIIGAERLLILRALWRGRSGVNILLCESALTSFKFVVKLWLASSMWVSVT